MGDNLGLTGAKLIFVMVERNGMSSDPKYTSDGFLYYEKVRNTITNYISFAISSLIISGAYLNHNWGQKDFINLMLWAIPVLLSICVFGYVIWVCIKGGYLLVDSITQILHRSLTKAKYFRPTIDSTVIGFWLYICWQFIRPYLYQDNDLIFQLAW